MDRRDLPIGFFDSGVGGISVLKEALLMLPNEYYIFYGDNGNAPYGMREEEEIRELSLKGIRFLFEKGVKAVVVACNTATSAAIEYIREEFPIPIIGMEPALKPAVQSRKDGKIIVMATKATLRQRKFNTLMERYGNEKDVILLPCPGLVEIIESGDLNGEEMETYLRNKLLPYKDANIDAVVLGCTHYIFIRKNIDRFFGGSVKIIDGNHGTVMQLKRVLEENLLLREQRADAYPHIDYYTSGDANKVIPLFKKLLTIDV